MMIYRSSYQKANATESIPEFIDDFWDGEEPRRMMMSGGLLESPAVIALVVTGDAAEYAKNPKESVTPYMALNQNLPPSIRYQHEIVLALHAGEAIDDSVWEAIFMDLKKDDDYANDRVDSLGLYFGDKEFKFQICMATGDYPFAASCLGLAGQKGRCNCRICYAAGYRVSGGYYLVHEEPYDDDENLEMMFPYVPIQHGTDESLLRTWEKYKTTVSTSGNANTTASKLIRLETGISVRGSMPSLVCHLEATRVPFHRLMPIDPMHAMSLNVVKIMMQFVTGKDSDMKDFDFCLSKEDMDNFFNDLLDCTNDIPEEFMKRPLVDFRKSSARSEHFVAIGRLAPILLAGRLPDKYMGAIVHVSYLLDDLARLCLSQDTLGELYERVVKFQENFYGNWYGSMVLRVPMCKTYFHAIGHLPDAVRAWGPPFVFSQYAMERLNGSVIKMARANGRTPIESSSNRITKTNQVRRIIPKLQATARRGPILGLRLKVSAEHFILTRVEKRALETYLKTSPDQIPESVVRYSRFYFKCQLDIFKVSAFQFRSSSSAIKRECRYAYCNSLDSIVDVQSLFEHNGESLAFVKKIKMERLLWDDYENEYLDNWDSCWGSRIAVISCNQITASVSFVRNSKFPTRRFLVRTLRVYNGDRYEEEVNDNDEAHDEDH